MTLLEIKDLCIDFLVNHQSLRAVDDVNISLNSGKILGIVGESGCGKSTLVSAILHLLAGNGRIAQGKIVYKGTDLAVLNEKEIRKYRGREISMIFQDPMTSLNPVFTVKDQLVEEIRLASKVSKKEAVAYAIKLLETVGIKNAREKINSYPYEFSGGMRQRVVIAMAIAAKPSLIIADEPTTALDVTVQKQILDLLVSLQKKLNTSIILITHDLGVVADIADSVQVMYAGQVVESAETKEIFKNPLHPYTKSLIKSIPHSNKNVMRIPTIEGSVPMLTDIPEGVCRFADRIPWIAKSSHEKNPQLHEVKLGHFVRCTCYKDFYFKGEKEAINVN